MQFQSVSLPTILEMVKYKEPPPPWPNPNYYHSKWTDDYNNPLVEPVFYDNEQRVVHDYLMQGNNFVDGHSDCFSAGEIFESFPEISSEELAKATAKFNAAILAEEEELTQDLNRGLG